MSLTIGTIFSESLSKSLDPSNLSSLSRLDKKNALVIELSMIKLTGTIQHTLMISGPLLLIMVFSMYYSTSLSLSDNSECSGSL